ncbi:MAG: septum formation initiator family protein [Bacteroidales bacterium]|nr:septum formation initiator family protein [Bacteroidales bacterium]
MNFLSNFKKHPYFKYLTNKYVITLIVFAVWVTFFGSNNLLSQWKLRQQLKERRAEREYYRREIETNRRNIYFLDNDLEHLERIAREQFLMKRDNEDIFIFIEQ